MKRWDVTLRCRFAGVVAGVDTIDCTETVEADDEATARALVVDGHKASGWDVLDVLSVEQTT